MEHLIAGVSATALTVAAARAIASAGADPAIDDAFAGLFVEASGHVELPRRIEDASPTSRSFWEQISGYLAARTRAFDAALVDAASGGVRQIVLVAAGLDARAFRVGWPVGTSIFEIDRAPVLDFKQRVLDAAAAEPRADRVTIASDVAHDWPAALADAGFESGAPTAWLVEGLLPYLPADLETSLVDRIDATSAPGSRAVLEFIRRPEETASLGTGATQISALFDAGPRPDTVGRLGSRGWAVRTEPVGDLVTWAFASR